MARTKKGSKGAGSEVWSRRTPTKAKGLSGKPAKKITSKTNRKMAKKEDKDFLKEEPLIHFMNENFITISPCGSENEDDITADRLDHVTCKKCLKYCAKKAH